MSDERGLALFTALVLRVWESAIDVKRPYLSASVPGYVAQQNESRPFLIAMRVLVGYSQNKHRKAPAAAANKGYRRAAAIITDRD